jgi:hypothetical protein
MEYHHHGYISMHILRPSARGNLDRSGFVFNRVVHATTYVPLENVEKRLEVFVSVNGKKISHSYRSNSNSVGHQIGFLYRCFRFLRHQDIIRGIKCTSTVPGVHAERH